MGDLVGPLAQFLQGTQEAAHQPKGQSRDKAAVRAAVVQMRLDNCRDLLLNLGERQGQADIGHAVDAVGAQGHVDHFLLQGRAVPKRHAKAIGTLGGLANFRTRGMIVQTGRIVPGRLLQDFPFRTDDGDARRRFGAADWSRA